MCLSHALLSALPISVSNPARFRAVVVILQNLHGNMVIKKKKTCSCDGEKDAKTSEEIALQRADSGTYVVAHKSR